MKTHLKNDETDILELFQILYSERWLMIGITAIITFITFVVSLLIPKTYKAEVMFEIPTFQSIQNIQVIKLPELSKVFKSYQKYNRSRLPFNVKISQIRDVQNGGKIEVEGRSLEEAKKNLELVINIINKEIFREKINDTKEKLEKRLASIDKAISNINAKNNIIYEPSKVADLLTEKENIEKWLGDPEVIRPLDVTVSSKPVKPKPVLYTAVGFVSGVFLGIFVALFRHALKSRSKKFT